MTQSTEQDRAEFLAWVRTHEECHGAIDEGSAWVAWQAARRAQVVPQGWRLAPIELLERATESIGSFVSDHGWEQADMDTFDDLSALAAAPQPPEAEKCQSCRTGSLCACTCPFKTNRNSDPSCFEAEPVQMPGPFTTLVRKNSWSTDCYEASPRSNCDTYGKQWADERVNVYTEHQVRQLLAQHGIK